MNEYEYNPNLITLLLIGGAIILALIFGGSKAAPAPQYHAAPVNDSYNITGSFNDNSWHWDFCAGYCPR